MRFSVDDRDVFQTYTVPIMYRAKPYAIVWTLGGNGYAVVSCDSNDDAMVKFDALLQRGETGLRLYLRCVYGLHQVHIEHVGPWPTHEQCLETAEWKQLDQTHGSKIGIDPRYPLARRT